MLDTVQKRVYIVWSRWILWHINSETRKPEDSLNHFSIYIPDIWPLHWNIFTGCTTDSVKWQNMQVMPRTPQTPEHKTFSNLILSAKSVTSHCLSITAAGLQPGPSQYHRTISHWLKSCLGDMWRMHAFKNSTWGRLKKGAFSLLSRLIKRTELVNISRASFVIEDESNENTTSRINNGGLRVTGPGFCIYNRWPSK